MSILCKIGRHRFKPLTTFQSYYVRNEQKYYVVSITGLECRCGERKLKKHEWEGQSAHATQEAYDWLNQRPKRAQVLRMVKM